MALLAGVVYGAFRYIQTEGAFQKAMEIVSGLPQSGSLGLKELHSDSGRLYPAFEVRGLKIKIESEEGREVDLEIDEMRLEYDLLKLLAKSIVIQRGSIQGVRLDGRMVAKVDSESEESSFQTVTEFVQPYQGILAELPVNLLVQNLNVTDLNASLEMVVSGGNQNSSLIKIARGHLELNQVEAGHDQFLLGSMKLRLPQEDPLLFHSTKRGERLDREISGEFISSLQVNFGKSERADLNVKAHQVELRELNHRRRLDSLDLQLGAKNYRRDSFEVEIELKIDRYSDLGPFLQPIGLQSKAVVQLDQRLRKRELHGDLSVEGEISNLPEELSFLKKTRWRVAAEGNELKRLTLESEENRIDLKIGSMEFGETNLHFMGDCDVKINHEILREFSKFFLSDEVQMKAHLDLSLVFPKERGDGIDGSRLTVQASLELPPLQYSGKGTLQGASLDVEIESDSLFQSPWNIHLKSDAKGLHLDRELSRLLGSPQEMGDLFVEMRLVGSPESQWRLEQLRSHLKSGWLGVDLSGTMGGDGGWFQSEGTLTLKLPEGAIRPNGVKLWGTLHVPWQVSLERSGALSVAGNVGFDRFHLATKKWELRGLKGMVPFQERLQKSSGSSHDVAKSGYIFPYIAPVNVFEKVDFFRVQPLLNQRDQLSVDLIRFEEKSYGPFGGAFSLNQNMLTIHSFDLVLGGGSMSGSLYLDLYPKKYQVGLLARFSDIKLNDVLPDRIKKIHGSEDRRVAGRSAWVLNLSESMASGRTDLYEIGADQLITLFNIVDPEFEDVQINKMRKALSLANPILVKIQVENGFMNLFLKLAGAVRLDFEVRAVPISTLLAAALKERMIE